MQQLTGDRSDVCLYDRILVTSEPHTFTGQMDESFDLCMLIVLFFSPFFWERKVMDTMSASSSIGSLWVIICDSLKNLMSPIVISFVLFDSVGLVVLEYSHDRIAKKKAPIISCADAVASGSLDDE